MPLVSIGGIRIKYNIHHKRGDCRCQSCVHVLVDYYKQKGKKITNTYRCTHCNYPLTHPQDVGQLLYSEDLSIVCCGCASTLRRKEIQLDHKHVNRAYHVAAGLAGAQARRRRQEHPIVMTVCKYCDRINCTIHVEVLI